VYVYFECIWISLYLYVHLILIVCMYVFVQKKWRPNTYHGHHKRLKVFFDWAMHKKKIITTNPVEHIEKPSLGERLPKSISLNDALIVLGTAASFPYHQPILPLRNHAIIATMLYAGLRRGEVCKLQCSDVDLQNNALFIRKGKGKGGKDRVVTILPKLKISLQRYKDLRFSYKRTCPTFFVQAYQDKGITIDTLRDLHIKLRDASGVPFTLHGLRHTFATLAIEGGCNIDSLRKALGHKRMETTSIYIDTSPKAQREGLLKHPLNFI